jgi:hypothetical protein
LKDPPGNAHNASILAYLNPEFDRHPVGVPPRVLGECEKHGETSASKTSASVSEPRNQKDDLVSTTEFA